MRALATAAVLIAATALPAAAQSASIDLGATGGPGNTSRLVQFTALIGLLSLAPSLLVMATAFARIVMVLSLLRSAVRAQGIPPNPVLVGLALFLAFFVMQPTLERSWTEGLEPMMAGRVGEMDGLKAAAEPFRAFMAAQGREADVSLFRNLSRQPAAEAAEKQRVPWRVLFPAFLVGELKRAFELGFLVFLPLLVIDMVVASLLMSLGVMMLPPSAVSLPMKLIFFVLVDGWRLTSSGLVQGFADAAVGGGG